MRNSLYILSQLDDTDILWLARVGTATDLADGASLISAGTPPSNLYIITDGTLDVNLPDGTSVAQRTIGDVLGEMSLLEKRPPATNVVALGPVRLLAVPLQTIRQELDQRPEFAGRFYKALALFLSDRLREATTARDSSGRKASIELDETMLDSVHVAGDRLLQLISMLDGR